MTSDDIDAELKIVDFGFAAIDMGGCLLTDRCGTPMYVAPEILQKIPHGECWRCFEHLTVFCLFIFAFLL
jgi:serine/threonine protein kinase